MIYISTNKKIRCFDSRAFYKRLKRRKRRGGVQNTSAIEVANNGVRVAHTVDRDSVEERKTEGQDLPRWLFASCVCVNPERVNTRLVYPLQRTVAAVEHHAVDRVDLASNVGS